MDITKTYKNGQAVAEQNGDIRIVYCKNGNIKAEGPFINEMMEGKWTFNKASGELWSTGEFLHNQKHGEWKRYDKNGALEYHEFFENGKSIEKRI